MWKFIGAAFVSVMFALAAGGQAAAEQTTTYCGVINEYVLATAAAPGRITIGSRVFVIAAGAIYAGDYLGERRDRTTVGQRMCLSGTLDADGRVIGYLTQGMYTSVGGTTSQYTPPTATRSGLLTLSPISGFPLKIPAAANFGVDLSRGSHCYAIGVDAAGDAIIERVIECELGRAASAPTTLPSTSTGDVAESSILAVGVALTLGGTVLLIRPCGRVTLRRGDSADPRPRD